MPYILSWRRALPRLRRRGKPRLYGKLVRRLFLQGRRDELAQLHRQRLPCLACVLQSKTAAGAMAAITAIAAAIDKLGAAQATIGKGENQLTYAVNLAQSQITNFSAAESQIRDANVAQQAANLSKAQVLTQASIAAM